MAAHDDRMIFNYPLPTEFYPQHHRHFIPHWTTSASRQSHSSVPRTLPTNTYIDPRQLERSYSSSSDDMNFHCSIRTPNMNSSKQRAYPVMLHQDHGHQPAYEPYGYLMSAGGRRGTTHTLQPQFSLPSPPLSPHLPSPTSHFPTITTSPAATTIASSSRHYCTHTSCIDPETNRSTKSFSRHADLIRHQKSLHTMTDEDGKSMSRYDCPRSRCNRKGVNGFTRLDHLTEHRRGYHGEDLPRRRVSGPTGGNGGRGGAGAGADPDAIEARNWLP